MPGHDGVVMGAVTTWEGEREKPGPGGTTAESSSPPEVTFFMIVTNPDALIADYAIRSYRLLARKNLHFRLRVYANGLSPTVERLFLPKWRKWPFVELDDNKAHITKDYPRRGGKVYAPDGQLIHKVNQDSWEIGCVIWSRELPAIDSPFVATVDADFEILDARFVLHALRRLRENPQLMGVSSDYAPDRPDWYNTYTGETCFLHQRWDTWCCIYRREALQCGVPHYYHKSQGADGRLHVYDDAGWLQHHLIRQQGPCFESLGPEWKNQFIHYTAFGKNQKVGVGNIGLYRRLRILMRRGLIPGLGFSGAKGRLNRWAGYGAHEWYMRRFGGVDKSRQKQAYLFNPEFSADRLYDK